MTETRPSNRPSGGEPAPDKAPWALTGLFLAIVLAWRLAGLSVAAWSGEWPAALLLTRAAVELAVILAAGILFHVLAGRAIGPGSATGAAYEPDGPEPWNGSRLAWRPFLDDLEDSGFLLDLKGRFLHVNPALAELTEHPAASLLGMSYEPLVAEMDLARVRRHFDAACRGRSQSYVAYGRRPDGSRFATQVINIPCRVRDQVVAVMGIARDVTEEIERPGELTDSEARYRAVFEHTPSAMVLTDPETGSILDANASAERLLRRPKAEILESGKADFLRPDDPATRAFMAARERDGVASDILPVRRGDGSAVSAEVTSVLYRDPDGRPRGIFFARDLSGEQAREARYRELFKHTTDGVFLTSPDGAIEAANPACQAMLGLGEREIVERGREGVVDTGDPAFAAFLEERESTGRASGILRMRRGDGSEFPAEVMSARFEDAEGRQRAFVVARDISERLAHEAALAASEERYRALFEQSAEAIFLTEPGGTIFAANRTAEALFGYSEAELCRLGRSGLVDEKEPAFKQLMAERREHNRARAEIHMRRKDGTWFLVDISVMGFRDPEGRDRTSVVLRDVTEERLREAQLRESEERFRSVFEHSPDAILIIDPETGQNMDANPATEKLFGLSRAQILARAREDDADPDDPAVQRFVEARRREGHARGTINLIRGDGTTFPADITSAMYRDSDGRLTATNMIRDISEQRRLLRELEDKRSALAELNATQEAILDALPAHIALLDGAGRVRYVNASWQRFASRNEYGGDDAGVGSDYLAVCEHAAARGERFAGRVAEAVRAIIAGERGLFDAEYECSSDTEQRWFRQVITPYHRGGARGAVVAHLDVTDRMLAERQLELMAAAFRHAEEALLICDGAFAILEVNEAYERLMGVTRDDVAGRRPAFLDVGAQGKTVLQGLEKEGHWQGDLMQRAANGRVFTSQATVAAIESTEGGRFLVVNFEDISGLREAERQVDYLSFHDALTGLPNRPALEQWFEEFVVPGGDRARLALVYLDLDYFKAVNESYGHSAGDELLKDLAERLRAACSPRDYVVRLGGDDFILILNDLERRGEVTSRVGRLLRTISDPFESRGRRLYVTATAGVSVFPEDGRDLETLLRRADAAHSEGKQQGRGQVMLYSPAMHEAVEQQALLESHLYDAIRGGELRLHFQPCVRLSDGAVLGFEALARWESPELGMVSPARFVPVAETSGLIIELGLWLFDTACAQLRSWLDAGLSFGRLALNLSPVQFQDPALVEQLQAAMERHGVAGRHLRVELTENVLVSDPTRTLHVLAELRALDIEIAVDDFGTGYSSMAYLRQFPVQAIKIDQTFIKALPDSATDASIVRSVISLSRDLGMTVIAEGVETPEQRECLLEWGCERAQGYYFSLPLGPEDIPWLLKEHERLPVGKGRPGSD